MLVVLLMFLWYTGVLVLSTLVGVKVLGVVMSGVRERLKSDLARHFKARDELETMTLRNVLGAVQTLEKSGKTEIVFSDEQIIVLIGKEIKKRRDTADEFVRVGAGERAVRETAEADFLAQYMPEQPDEADVLAAVDSVISGFVSPTVKDMGSIMKAVGECFPGVPLDNRFVSGAVRARLS